jgi:hypothetical protein
MTDGDSDERPSDELDREILERLRVLHDRLDPAPTMLDDLVLFALDPARADRRLASLVREEASASVRGPQHTRTLSFEAGETSVLLTVVALSGDRVRLDGWLAPPEIVDIELRILGDSISTNQVRTDEQGRFVVAAAPRGHVQLVVHTRPPVITPAVQL